MTPSVTVVIPAFRAERTILRAVESALAQKEQAAIIVVIDGRTDETEARLASVKDARLQVIVKPRNEGGAAARNTGLARVQTDFVLFLDADDYLEGAILSGLADQLRSGADVGLAPMVIEEEESGRRSMPYFPPSSDPITLFELWHLEGHFTGTCSLMWRTSFLRQIGGWDESLTRNDDGELAMRALLMGGVPVRSALGAGVYVKHSAESVNNRTDNMESMLRANAKLAILPSSVIPDDLRKRVVGGHYFNVAWHLYAANQFALGDEALRRSRDMGFGVRGPLTHRLAAWVLGPKSAARFLARLRTIFFRFRRMV